MKDPTGTDTTVNIRHGAGGIYEWNIDGTDFNPADLNYNADDEVLEYVAWADQFDPDSPPAGSTVYRTDIQHLSHIQISLCLRRHRCRTRR